MTRTRAKKNLVEKADDPLEILRVLNRNNNQ